MSIVAKFMEEVEYCPLCGSHSFKPLLGVKENFSAGAVNGFVDGVVNGYCNTHFGIAPEDFDIDIKVIDPKDLASEFYCESCQQHFRKADCVFVHYEGDDYKPGDQIEQLVIDVFQETTGEYYIECDSPLCSQINYIQKENFNISLYSVFGTKKIYFLDDIAESIGTDEENLTLNQIIYFYCSHQNELDEYANMSIIDRAGLRESFDKAKKITNDFTSSESFKETTSSVKKALGINDKDIDKAKSLFKSLFD